MHEAPVEIEPAIAEKQDMKPSHGYPTTGAPLQDLMRTYAVANRVGNVRNNDADLLVPLAA